MADDAAAEAGAAALLDGIAARRANSANPANPSRGRGVSGSRASPNFARTLAGDDIRDCVVTPPVSSEAMFYGLLGRIAKQAASGTEVHPAAAMLGAMTWLSAAMGRNTCIEVGDSLHHMRLFALHVGRSSRGGKGMAVGLLKRVIKAAQALADGPSIVPKKHMGGLSSREGLALLIHDGFREGKEDVPPIDDKRLWIHESEFANLLAQAARHGNTLSSALRDAWDGVSITPATKTSQVGASRPHIALHGCVTPTELREKIGRGELSNGFANRFLVVWAERIGINPFPERCPESLVHGFANELAGVIRFGLAGYPSRNDLQLLKLNVAARELYAKLYAQFSRPHPGGELITGLLQRRAPMTLRMAGLFALTDLSLVIEPNHIEAAAAWMEFFAQSVALIFGPMVDVESETARNESAEQLSRYLISAGGWKSRTLITRECFRGHLPAKEIDEALSALALEGRIERREQDTGGVRKQTEYRASPAVPSFAKPSQQISRPGSLAESKLSQGSQSSPVEIEI